MTDNQYRSALALYGQGRHEEGAQLLAQAARGGHAPSMSLLGHRMLSGRGAALDPATGVRLIMGAAARGGGMACTLAAALLAAGVSGKPEWPMALDYLRRGAELGFGMAQAQLRILAGRPGDDWDGLARDIDLEALFRAPEPTILSDDPSVRAFAGVASRAACEWLILRTRDRMRPAMIYGDDGGEATSGARNNSAAELGLGDVDLVVLALRERLASAAGLAVMQMDAPQVLHYTVGQSFRHHVDFFDPAIASNAAEMTANGQRVATALVYLNEEGLEGGQTDFPRLEIRHRGRQGDALVFFNVDSTGQPDRRTLHAGLPPTQGEKWLFSQWIRDRVRAGAGDPSLLEALNGR